MVAAVGLAASVASARGSVIAGAVAVLGSVAMRLLAMFWGAGLGGGLASASAGSGTHRVCKGPVCRGVSVGKRKVKWPDSPKPARPCRANAKSASATIVQRGGDAGATALPSCGGRMCWAIMLHTHPDGRKAWGNVLGRRSVVSSLCWGSSCRLKSIGTQSKGCCSVAFFMRHTVSHCGTHQCKNGHMDHETGHIQRRFARWAIAGGLA